MVNLNKISYKISKGARSFVAGMGNSTAIAPVVLLETTVTTGRTYQAHKRGGFIEARERATEETLGAIFWLGGVKFFNHLGDYVGKKLLKLSHIDFDADKDAIRDPFQQFLNKVKRASRISKNPNVKNLNIAKLEKTLAIFKFTKVISSILISNALIGFVVPKINQAITRRYQKSVKDIGQTHTELHKNAPAMNDFVNKKQKKDINFKGFLSVQNLLTTANKFENDANYQLLSTDVGIAGGRTISARNKHERFEVLIRDVGSIYFYLFCRKHINAMFNKIEDGRKTRLDPVSAKQVHDELIDKLSTQFKESAFVDSETFLQQTLGTKREDLTDSVKAKIKSIEFHNGVITLDDFMKVEKDKDLIKTAKEMSRLQPEMVDKGAILTKMQVYDIYKGGVVNNPEFLQKVYEQFTNKKSSNHFKFVKNDDIEQLKHDIESYVKDIAKNAKSHGDQINTKLLTKMCRQNYIKNVLNLGLGFGISAFFLSTVIPKIQYWYTRFTTGQNNFPGVTQYGDSKKK